MPARAQLCQPQAWLCFTIPFQPLCCSIPYGEADKLGWSSLELGLLLAAPVGGEITGASQHTLPLPAPGLKPHVLPCLGLEQP